MTAAAAAAALRPTRWLPRLGTPHALVFDETYYAKDALSLLRYGYERKVIQGADATLLGGDSDIFTDLPSYVVHPPLGKWVIAAGESLFGPTPFGWRIMVALVGIASVLIVGRIARRLTRSNVIGTVTALLLALDGLHIAMSRTALLDTTLSFFVLCAFGFAVMDMDRHIAGFRWTRVGMTVMLGLACATKWSGVYFAAAFVVMLLAWDFGRRPDRRVWLARDVAPASLMPLAVIGIYLSSWVGWFASDNAWDRHWGERNTGAMGALRGLWHYHADMLSFHTHLASEHNYRANPLGWPLMIRPTSFYYETPSTCGVASCAQEVIPLGNPLVWWLGAAALVWLAVLVARRVSHDALPILVGFGAGWLPWLYFHNRTTFTFYAVVFLPYTAMALAKAAHLIGNRGGEPRDHWSPVTIGLVAAVAVLTAFFFPVLTGITIPYDSWRLRMWLPSWI